MNKIRYTQPLAQHTIANKVQQFVLKNNCKVEHYSDEYKTAWGLKITMPDGSKIDVYDYKETSLYGQNLPTPKEIIKTKKKLEWHIQASNDILLQAFMNHVNKEA